MDNGHATERNDISRGRSHGSKARIVAAHRPSPPIKANHPWRLAETPGNGVASGGSPRNETTETRLSRCECTLIKCLAILFLFLFLSEKAIKEAGSIRRTWSTEMTTPVIENRQGSPVCKCVNVGSSVCCRRDAAATQTGRSRARLDRPIQECRNCPQVSRPCNIGHISIHQMELPQPLCKRLSGCRQTTIPEFEHHQRRA